MDNTSDNVVDVASVIPDTPVSQAETTLATLQPGGEPGKGQQIQFNLFVR